MKMMKVSFRVNNETVALQVRPYETLLETLRERLALTGAKEGCGMGVCGACTVLVDGIPLRSCLVLTSEVEGTDITTIEGLADGENIHALQEAFVKHGGIQCGFCTPGMIMSATALLKENPDPTPLQIRKAISGNLCRCTGYQQIVDSVQAAAKTMDKP